MELNPFAYEFHDDPYPTYRWLRDHRPLYHNPKLGFWALSRYRDVLAASYDWQTYSSAEGTTIERLDPSMFEQLPMMIFSDPPRHDRLRKLVNRAFTQRRVADLEPFIRATVRRLLTPLHEAGGGDFVKDFSMPLPMEARPTMVPITIDSSITSRPRLSERQKEPMKSPTRCWPKSAPNQWMLRPFIGKVSPPSGPWKERRTMADSGP